MAERDRQAELVTEAEFAELVHDCPTLYHMAEKGSWPSIEQHGLLSTSSLLDMWEVDGARRLAIERRRRPESVILEHPKYGRAVVRDQKPMDDTGLRRCLQDGLRPEDWYVLLNARVFFWLTPARLHRLLGAKPYRDIEHDVLELRTAALLEAHRERVTLSPINSGATKPFPRSRGRDTFLPIHDYPYGEWRTKRQAGERAVEVGVLGGVPDVWRFVSRVTRMKGIQTLNTIFPGA